uniref:Uncharacterized protein n=1 Tax=Panagrolaimus sp. JU765 TaxID=591449 RepID=A0AC34QGL7_9BILA
MASSRGRAKLAERSSKKFAFGSSTPRELSHISLPPVFRTIDSKSQRELAARSHSSSSVMATSLLLMARPKINVGYYVRKAHHSQPPSKSSTETHNVKSFAFGSSTPREFAHLNRILPALRVYDAKIRRKKEIPPKSPSLNENKKMRSVSSNHQQKSGKVEDDIASEPDIVQYRHFEFLGKKMNDDNQNFQETSKAEENSVVTELAQELATEAQQPLAVVKQLNNELNHQDDVVTVPVVEAHDDSNPVLNEDHLAFEGDGFSIAKSLGNLEDVAHVLKNDLVLEDQFQQAIVIDDDIENDASDNSDATLESP